MEPKESEFLITLVSGHKFTMEPNTATDLGSQARTLLAPGGTVSERHDDESFTMYPAHQVVSVTVQPTGTGKGKAGPIPWRV